MLPAVRPAVVSPQPEVFVAVQIAAERPPPPVAVAPPLRLPRLMKVPLFGVL